MLIRFGHYGLTLTRETGTDRTRWLFAHLWAPGRHWYADAPLNCRAVLMLLPTTPEKEG